jgi:hypothetical protein
VHHVGFTILIYCDVRSTKHFTILIYYGARSTKHFTILIYYAARSTKHFTILIYYGARSTKHFTILIYYGARSTTHFTILIYYGARSTKHKLKQVSNIVFLFWHVYPVISYFWNKFLSGDINLYVLNFPIIVPNSKSTLIRCRYPGSG